jgi:threonine dehydratase
LIRGLAASAKQAKPSVTIVGVVAANAPAYLRSWQQGAAVGTASADTIADGLAVTRPLAGNVDAIRRLVDDVRAVTEDEMLAAIRHLRNREGLVAEPSGTAATAAYMKDRSPGAANVLLVTGCNIAPGVIGRL